MEKIKKYGKWLLLLPITIIGFVIVRLINSSPVNQRATDSLIKAVKKNAELLSEQKQLEVQSESHSEKAKEIQVKIEELAKDDDLDWHLKIKK